MLTRTSLSPRQLQWKIKIRTK